MANKKKEKGIFEKVLDFGAQKLENTVEQYVEEKITNKLVKIGEVSLAFLLGIICVIVGVAQFAASQIAFLENGLNYVLIGSILLLLAYFLSK